MERRVLIQDCERPMPSVDLIPYDSMKHADEIKSWLKARFLDSSMVDDYPEDTWVSVHGADLIAAAALGKSDTPMSFIVGMVTNPSAEAVLRNLSIDALTKQIIQKSKYLGFKQLFAWTENPSILKRSFEYGFKPINQIMIALEGN